MTLIETEYELGQKVYLKTDKEQDMRIVKGILVSAKGIEYNLGCGTVSSWHGDFEMTDKINVLTKTGVQ